MSLSRLGKVALSAVIVGAAGSFLLMLRVGHPPLLLRVLFAGWVLSPFVALVLAIMMARRWPSPVQLTLHLVMLIVSVGCLVTYGGILPVPPGTKPAALYLLVPLASWLLLVMLVTAAALIARKR